MSNLRVSGLGEVVRGDNLFTNEVAREQLFSWPDFKTMWAALRALKATPYPRPIVTEDKIAAVKPLQDVTLLELSEIKSARFKADSVRQIFLAVENGTRVIGRNSAATAAVVEVLQLSLYSLGYNLSNKPDYATTDFLDGVFGKGTEKALKQFQKDFGLKQTGILDAETLWQLDKACVNQTTKLAETLNANTNDAKKNQYKLVVDLTTSNQQRLYVVDKTSDKVVAMYLCSGGVDAYQTPRGAFTFKQIFMGPNPKMWWYPPNTDWAQGLEPVPPGIHNPMGVLKAFFKANGYYLHGIPTKIQKDLGKKASHGCIRLGSANVLEVFANYMGTNSQVQVIKLGVGADQELHDKLEKYANDPHNKIKLADLHQGREYFAAIKAGELGTNLSNNEAIVEPGLAADPNAEDRVLNGVESAPEYLAKKKFATWLKRYDESQERLRAR